MIANTIKPHVAIITDVTHDTSTPLINNKIQGDIKCGLGPTLTYAPAVHNLLREQVIEVAESKRLISKDLHQAEPQERTQMLLPTATEESHLY